MAASANSVVEVDAGGGGSVLLQPSSDTQANTTKAMIQTRMQWLREVGASVAVVASGREWAPSRRHQSGLD
jgi:hypothetical protein